MHHACLMPPRSLYHQLVLKFGRSHASPHLLPLYQNLAIATSLLSANVKSKFVILTVPTNQLHSHRKETHLFYQQSLLKLLNYK